MTYFNWFMHMSIIKRRSNDKMIFFDVMRFMVTWVAAAEIFCWETSSKGAIRAPIILFYVLPWSLLCRLLQFPWCDVTAPRAPWFIEKQWRYNYAQWKSVRVRWLLLRYKIAPMISRSCLRQKNVRVRWLQSDKKSEWPHPKMGPRLLLSHTIAPIKYRSMCADFWSEKKSVRFFSELLAIKNRSSALT